MTSERRHGQDAVEIEMEEQLYLRTVVSSEEGAFELSLEHMEGWARVQKRGCWARGGHTQRSEKWKGPEDVVTSSC